MILFDVSQEISLQKNTTSSQLLLFQQVDFSVDDTRGVTVPKFTIDCLKVPQRIQVLFRTTLPSWEN